MRLAAIERLDGITANLRAGDRLRYLRSGVLPRAGSDATSAEWVDTSQITLGLDHAQILADAKAKIFSTSDRKGTMPKLTTKDGVAACPVACAQLG